MPDQPSDNLSPSSPRLFSVVDREEWEGALRRCLADQAGGAPPTPTDLSSTAISAARRTQRRRAVIGLASVVAATVLATGGWMQGWLGVSEPAPEFGAVTGVVGDSGAVSPQPESPVRLAADEHLPEELAADLVTEGAAGGPVLATADGHLQELPGVRQVSAAQRLGEGWLVAGGQPGALRLWWIAAGKQPAALLAGMDAIAVAGSRVSWQRGSLLSAATLSTAGELTGRVSTAAPAAGQPVGFLGEAVLLQRTTGEATSWDAWHPASGDYQPAWSEHVVQVYGSLPSGSALGLVTERPGGDRLCLARLHVKPALGVSARQCLPGELADELSAGGPAALSPQGRWLVTGASTDPLLVDLPELFGGGAAEAVTPLTGVARLAAKPGWLGPERVLLSTEDHLVQLRPGLAKGGDAAAVETFPLGGAPPVVVESG